MAKLNVTLADGQQRTTKRSIGMEAQALLADYVAAAAAWAAAFTDVSDLGIVKMDLMIPIVGEETEPESGANIDVGATFTGWLDSAVPKKGTLKVPGIKSSFVGLEGAIAITGDLATYCALFETDGDFNVSDGEQISAWTKGRWDK